MQYVTLRSGVPELAYARQGDAGLDLAVIEFTALAPFGDPEGHDQRLFPTGIAVKIPEGHFGMIVPRSSMGKRGLMLANTVGIIDSGYTGELMVLLRNMKPTVNVIEAGDRVAQLVIVPFTTVKLERVLVLPETERGAGGFGSTG
jgi:dUTP pyrophosphatase